MIVRSDAKLPREDDTAREPADPRLVRLYAELLKATCERVAFYDACGLHGNAVAEQVLLDYLLAVSPPEAETAFRRPVGVPS